jgi:hypothetical protein
MEALMKTLIWPSVYQPYKGPGAQFSGRAEPFSSISIFAPIGVNPLLWRVGRSEPTLPGYVLCCGSIDWLHTSGMVCQTPSESSWMQNGRPASTPYHTPKGPTDASSAWVNGSPDEKSDLAQCLPALQRSWCPIFRSNRAFFLHLDFAPTGVNHKNWRVWGFEPTWPGYVLCCGLID